MGARCASGAWSQQRFGELLVDMRNGIYKPKQHHGSGTPIVNMGELFAYPRLWPVPMKRLSLSAGELDRFALRPGDLLFARRSLVAEGAGKVCVVCGLDEPTVFESSIIRARPDPSRANSFYYYYFSSPQGLHALDTIRRQVAVAGVTGSDLAGLPVPTPPLSEQRAIAHVLGTLDDRIELNRRMNETLGAMARAIFRSWFVDFDPVWARKEGRQPYGMDAATAALFPDDFEDSELGYIPRGWRVVALGDLVELAYGKALKETERRPGAVAVYGSNGPTGEHDKPLAVGPGIVVGRKGANAGSVTWAPNDYWVIDTAFYVKPRDGLGHPRSLFYVLSHAGLRDAVGDSAIPGLDRETAESLAICAPPGPLLAAFEETVTELERLVYANDQQAGSLRAVRDALVPKLMSGEVRVSTGAGDLS